MTKNCRDCLPKRSYDIIIKELRKYKNSTFRGYGHGDIMSDPLPKFGSLRGGQDFHYSNEYGYLPAGLVEEIRTLTTPPIPQEVELAEWFDEQFPPLEKYRSYAQPSKRRSSTPDIPRPRYSLREGELKSRTFGVVVDTSGSVSLKQLSLSLGAIASYAVAKEVERVRIVFCDAEAHDAGYMTPKDLAGRIKVTGRGGTMLQPGVDLLDQAKDFPRNSPILIITDGEIENKLQVKREHAYLLPKGNKLPFVPRGKVFYFTEQGKLAQKVLEKSRVSKQSCYFRLQFEILSGFYHSKGQGRENAARILCKINNIMQLLKSIFYI